MACFIVPAVEAIVTVAAVKNIEKKEAIASKASENVKSGEQIKIPFSRKLRWLTNLLFGGSALLLFEHIWHGEVVPWFPFLTAASNAQDTAEMLYEMATAGVAMAVLSTAVWGVMLLVAHIVESKSKNSESEEENA